MTVIAPKAISLKPSCFAVTDFALAKPISARIASRVSAMTTQADAAFAIARATAATIARICATNMTTGEACDVRTRRRHVRTYRIAGTSRAIMIAHNTKLALTDQPAESAM